LSEGKFFIKKLAYCNYGYSKHAPQKAVDKAYLTAEIKRAARIVPYIEFKAEVKDKARKKLYEGYNDTSYYAFKT